MENLEFNAKQKEYVKALELQVEDQKFQIEYLKQQINYLTHKEYGRRSEQLDKQYPNLFNYDIFNEAEDNTSSEEN